MAPHSSTLAWKIPWTEEEPGGLQSMGSLRVGHDWATSLSLFTFMHWRRKWQPTPVFLPRESQGRGSLVGPGSMGSHRVGHNWSISRTQLKWLSSSSSSRSLLLHVSFLWLWWAGAMLRCGVWTSRCRGFSCCRACARGTQAAVVAVHGFSSCGSKN